MNWKEGNETSRTAINRNFTKRNWMEILTLMTQMLILRTQTGCRRMTIAVGAFEEQSHL